MVWKAEIGEILRIAFRSIPINVRDLPHHNFNAPIQAEAQTASAPTPTEHNLLNFAGGGLSHAVSRADGQRRNL